MKKLLLPVCFSIIAVISLCSFTIDATLSNEEVNQQLFLYRDGTCVVRVSNGARGTGKYDIKGSTIYFTWDNGKKQQGKYLPTGSVYHTTRICVEGVCYDAARRVVSRSR